MLIGHPGAGVVAGTELAVYVNERGVGTESTVQVPLYAESVDPDTRI
jgi:hypothetical protein